MAITRVITVGSQGPAGSGIPTAGDEGQLLATVAGVPEWVDPPDATPDADASTKGKLQLAEDIGGTSAAPEVVGLRGTQIASTPPAVGEALAFDGTSYIPDRSRVDLSVDSAADAALVTAWLATLSGGERAALGFSVPPTISAAAGCTYDDDPPADDEPTFRAFLAYADYQNANGPTSGFADTVIKVRWGQKQLYHLAHPIFRGESFVTMEGSGSSCTTLYSRQGTTGDITNVGGVATYNELNIGGGFLFYDSHWDGARVPPTPVDGPLPGTLAIDFDPGVDPLMGLTFRHAEMAEHLDGKSGLYIEFPLYLRDDSAEFWIIGSSGSMNTPNDGSGASYDSAIHLRNITPGAQQVMITTSGNGRVSVNTTMTITLNAWHWVGINYDNVGGTIKVFIDGVQQASQGGLSGTIVCKAWEHFSVGTSVYTLGNGIPFYGGIDGKIGEIRVTGASVHTSGGFSLPSGTLTTSYGGSHVLLCKWDRRWLDKLEGVETPRGVAWLVWTGTTSNTGRRKKVLRGTTINPAGAGGWYGGNDSECVFDDVVVMGGGPNDNPYTGLWYNGTDYTTYWRGLRVVADAARLGSCCFNTPQNGPNSLSDFVFTGGSFGMITAGETECNTGFINGMTTCYVAAHAPPATGGGLGLTNVMCSAEAAGSPTEGLLNIKWMANVTTDKLRCIPYDANTKIVVVEGGTNAAEACAIDMTGPALYSTGNITPVFTIEKVNTGGIRVRGPVVPEPTTRWLDDYVKNIVSSTDATPIVMTVTSHGLKTGDRVHVFSHATNTNANGSWAVIRTGADTFSLTGSTATGGGAGGATGQIYRTSAVPMSVDPQTYTGRVSIAMVAGRNVATRDHTLYRFVKLTGALGAPATLQWAPVLGEWRFHNDSGDAVTVTTSAGTGISVANGKRATLSCDGTNILRETADV